MERMGVPYYSHELILSSMIAMLGLDETIDEITVSQRVSDDNFISGVYTNILKESTFYESTVLDRDMVQQLLQEFKREVIKGIDVLTKLKQTLLHSMAHILLLSAAITAGSQLEDLDYLINESKNEIIIFDSVSGGNGVSETVFEFLSDSTRFNVSEYLASDEKGESYRPRSFEEVGFELLLPCVNGVADRIFLFGESDQLMENEIRRKLNELKDKQATHTKAVERIKKYGKDKMYPIGIGYHAVDYSNDSHEADRFKEAANSCLHGCPECISIASKCHLGAFQEKYGVSKLVLDEFLIYMTREAIVDNLSQEEVLRIIDEKGFAILRGVCSIAQSCKSVSDKLDNTTLALDGKKTKQGLVKLSGHWLNFEISNGNLIYYYLLRAI
jgi:hypothetical protein